MAVACTATASAQPMIVAMTTVIARLAMNDLMRNPLDDV